MLRSARYRSVEEQNSSKESSAAASGITPSIFSLSRPRPRETVTGQCWTGVDRGKDRRGGTGGLSSVILKDLRFGNPSCDSERTSARISRRRNRLFFLWIDRSRRFRGNRFQFASGRYSVRARTSRLSNDLIHAVSRQHNQCLSTHGGGRRRHTPS